MSRSAQLAELAVRSAVPTVFEHREFVVAGGLMSYGSDLTETYHQAGVYCGLILKGGNTADLPVYQSTKVEFFINLRTASRSVSLCRRRSSAAPTRSYNELANSGSRDLFGEPFHRIGR